MWEQGVKRLEGAWACESSTVRPWAVKAAPWTMFTVWSGFIFIAVETDLSLMF